MGLQSLQKNDPFLHRDYSHRNDIQHDRSDDISHSIHYYQLRKCISHVSSKTSRVFTVYPY